MSSVEPEEGLSAADIYAQFEDIVCGGRFHLIPNAIAPRMWKDLAQQYGSVLGPQALPVPAGLTEAEWTNQLQLQKLFELLEKFRGHLEGLRKPNKRGPRKRRPDLSGVDLEGASLAIQALLDTLAELSRSHEG
jgi:hypothetical protein